MNNPTLEEMKKVVKEWYQKRYEEGRITKELQDANIRTIDKQSNKKILRQYHRRALSELGEL